MSKFTEIKPEELNNSPFQLIGHDWMLITAEHDNRVNTMTASWGGMGVMWGKNVAYIVLRPQRYTKELVDSAETFSLTFFDSSFKNKLSYLGSASGRNEDKISKAELTVLHADNTPYFAQGKLSILCKKLYSQPFKPEYFMAPELDEKWYPQKDYHTLYIAEIQKILMKE